MNLVHVNCPECQKLFMVRHADLRDGFVKFNCTQCAKFFGFDWPQPPGTDHVVARMIEAPKHFRKAEALPGAQATVNTSQNQVTQTCPRCQTKVAVEFKECPQCGVMFEKVKKLNAVPGMKANAEMEGAWQGVLKEYENLKIHEGFIQTCLKHNNLVYASHQYGNILKTTANDEVAKKMQDRIVELASLAYLSNQAREVEPKRKLNLIGIGLGVAFLFIVTGIFTAKSLIAVGCGIIAFILGLRIFGKVI